MLGRSEPGFETADGRGQFGVADPVDEPVAGHKALSAVR
jgi:hypothetical protein